MKILPKHIFVRTSHRTPDEVIERLKQASEPSWDKFRYLKSGKIFAGQVLKNSFRLIRIDPLRTKNRPIIAGKVTADDSGSKIMVKVAYRGNQSIGLLVLVLFFTLIFFLMGSFIPSRLVAGSITLFIAIIVLGVLRLEFERECHEIEETFDKNV